MVLSKNKLGKNLFSCRHLESHWKKAESVFVSGAANQWYGSADLDPYQNVTDPETWTCLEGKNNLLSSYTVGRFSDSSFLSLNSCAKTLLSHCPATEMCIFFQARDWVPESAAGRGEARGAVRTCSAVSFCLVFAAHFTSNFLALYFLVVSSSNYRKFVVFWKWVKFLFCPFYFLRF